MRVTVCVLLTGILCANPLLAAQKSVASAVEIDALKRMVTAIPPGTRVKLQTTAGRRMTATLMAVDADGVIVKRASRLPEPAVTVPFTELARLERDEKGGFSVAKAVGIGLASGAGAMLTLFAIALSIDD